MSTVSRPSSPLRPLAHAALAGLLLTAGLGCEGFESDTQKADKKVRAAATQTAANLRRATEANLQGAVKDLNAALKEKDADEARRIQARSLLAQSEFELGDRAAIDLIGLESLIAGKIWEVGQAGDRVQAINLEVDALNLAKPDETLAAIAKQRADLAAAADAAAKKAGELQSQIEKAKGEIAELAKQQAALRAQADADRTRAATLKGKEQADVLDAVTEAVRKAENLGHEIFKRAGALTPLPDSTSDTPWADPKNKPLLPLERDMAVENQKKASAEQAIAGLAATEKTVNDEWANVQAKVAERQQAAKDTGAQLAAKADELAKLEADAAALRDTALKHYKNAETAWATTVTEAKKLGERMQKWSADQSYARLPESGAWKQLGEVYNNHYFRLLQGRALDRQGTRKAALAVLTDAKAQTAARVAPILTKASVPAPATLNVPPGDPEKTAAKASFDAALVLYKDVFDLGVNPAALKDAALLSNMFTLYAEYQLTQDAAKLQAAKSAMTEFFTPDRIEKDPKLAAFKNQLPADLRA
ncbi:MAG TPA: hypothetical protein VK986_19490 [Tepidisphaeraceae bacterium]|nr:hypothetical protein [Tepidisphaeraceae bacterium]